MTKATAIVRDENASHEAMAIVEKYEAFLNYVYPKVQSCPRKHGVVRDLVLTALFVPVPGFIAAGKSKQISRLYAVDADLGTVRFWLRFMAHPERKILTDQHRRVALRHLSEVGAMLGTWIKRSQSGKGSDASARSMG